MTGGGTTQRKKKSPDTARDKRKPSKPKEHDDKAKAAPPKHSVVGKEKHLNSTDEEISVKKAPIVAKKKEPATAIPKKKSKGSKEKEKEEKQHAKAALLHSTEEEISGKKAGKKTKEPTAGAPRKKLTDKGSKETDEKHGKPREEKTMAAKQRGKDEVPKEEKAKKPKEKEEVVYTKEVIQCIDEYVASTNFQAVEAVNERLQQMNIDAGQHTKCCQYKDRNRDESIHCLDETRFVLEPKEGEKDGCDFIHASNVTVEGASNPFIVAQAPTGKTVEDFWRMIFQAQSSAVVVTCNFFENGSEACKSFWPMKSNEFAYHGKMFVNNKKTEYGHSLTYYIIEILPEGCSNSLIVGLWHLTVWPPATGAGHFRSILRAVRSPKTTDGGPITVVSKEGTGRACAYVLINTVISRLFKGQPTKFEDVAVAIRKQRAFAFTDPVMLLNSQFAILTYIGVKMDKYSDAAVVLQREAEQCCK